MIDWTDEEVISFCRENKNIRKALTLFLTHFNDLIDHTIDETLNEYDVFPDEDIVRNINVELVEKFTCPQVFHKIIYADSPPAYLVITARNHTRDWLRKKRTNRNAPERYAEQGICSLSDPVYSDSNKTLADTISAPPQLNREELDQVDALVDAIWEHIENLRETHRLIMQVLLIEFRSLSPDTIREIARKRQVDIAVIQKEVAGIETELARRREEREEAQDQALQLYAEILLLQKKLYAMKRAPGTNESDITAVEREIEKKQTTRRRHLRDMEANLRTPSSQVAGLLGLPEEQVQMINTLHSRVRRILKNKYENNNEDDDIPEDELGGR